MEEIWKPVVGFEDLYEVSNLGRVKSVGRYENGHTGKKYSMVYFRKEKILKPSLRKGYPFVSLRKDGKAYNKNIHRLVAEAFIPNQYNLPMINHKDENPLNNIVDNLEWCNAKYNNTYGNRLKKSAAKTSKPINQYDLEGNFIRQFKSISDAKRQTGVNNISMVLIGKRKKAGGSIWKYAA